MNFLIVLLFLVLSSYAGELWNLVASEWEELDDLISGDVVLPTDDDYSTKYVLWTATYDNVYPEAVIYASDKNDVATIWQWLLTKTDDISQKLVTLRTCKHSFGGWSTSYGVVIDLSNLQTLSIDEDETLENGQTVKTAHVGPGVNLATFTEWAEENDVTLPHGDCASVCFGGFLLGGGFGVTSRTFGMGIDWIKSMDVVLIDTGELVTISADNEYSDLFWAMKGAGQGHFAILTEYYMRIPWKKQTQPGLYVSLEWEYTEENWKQISSVWKDYVNNDEYGTRFAIYLRIQPIETLGTDYYINFHGFWTGEQSDGLNMLGSLYNDIGITPSSSKIEYDHFEGWISPSNPNRYRYSSLCKSRFKIDGPDIDTSLFKNMYNQVSKLQDYNVPEDQDSTNSYNYPTTFMFLAPAGGAIKYHTTEEAAFPWRSAEYLYVVCTRWESTNSDAYNFASNWLADTMNAVEPYLSTDASFVNFPDNKLENYLQLYYGDSLERLIQIKAKYNPTNIFQHPQSIMYNQDNDSNTKEEDNDPYAITPRDPSEVTLYDTYLNNQISVENVLPFDKTVDSMNLKPKTNTFSYNDNNNNDMKTKYAVKHVKKQLNKNMKNGNTKNRDRFLEKYGLTENDISNNNENDDNDGTNNNNVDDENETLNSIEKKAHKKTSKATHFIRSIPIWVYIILASIIGIISVYYYKKKIYNSKNPIHNSNTKYTKLNQDENDYVAIGSQHTYSTFQQNQVIL